MRFTVKQILLLTGVIAVLLAIPRLKLEMLESYVIGIMILHQVSYASLLGLLIWYALGKCKFIGNSLAAIICAVWLPFTIDIAERTISGDPTMVHRVTETLELADEYHAIWYNISSTFNYQMRIAPQ